ncbi:Uu.00g062770.m01.CDS01 [Anthostomella pinea]|uniref:Uu.00g062770.m01.CDS01 n=1 Tax=Anthostomella pinea TaxID=933095 RepID=A0AAI8YKI6_9PEZI|nr:Uu.00g062770.m01.CDS01 [Anthostomella pinea]
MTMIAVQGVSLINKKVSKHDSISDETSKANKAGQTLGVPEKSARPRSKSDSSLQPMKTEKDRADSLRTAVEKNKPEEVEEALKQGASVESIMNKRQGRPLHVAASKGFVGILDKLLLRGAKVNALNADGATPLIAALDFGQVTTSLILIGSGAKISPRAKGGESAVQFAARRNLLLPLQCLLKSGADANEADDEGLTPLIKAAGGRDADGQSLEVNMEILRTLLDAGADPTIGSVEAGRTPGSRLVASPLHILARADHSTALDLLAEKAGTLDVHAGLEYYHVGATPLYVAAFYGKRKFVSVLLKRGAKVDERCLPAADLPNALWAALHTGHFDTAAELLENGADPNSQGSEDVRNVYLHTAAEAGSETAIKLLLEHGANVDAKDAKGQTPFSRAMWKVQYAAAQLLLDKGADMDAIDNRKRTALMYAAAYGELRAIHYLCSKGAKPQRTDDRGESAFMLAVAFGHADCAAYLLALGADVEKKAVGGATELREPFKAVGTAEKVAKTHGNDEIADCWLQ